jgi:hypothetical protein
MSLKKIDLGRDPEGDPLLTYFEKENCFLGHNKGKLVLQDCDFKDPPVQLQFDQGTLKVYKSMGHNLQI